MPSDLNLSLFVILGQVHTFITPPIRSLLKSNSIKILFYSIFQSNVIEKKFLWRGPTSLLSEGLRHIESSCFPFFLSLHNLEIRTCIFQSALTSPGFIQFQSNKVLLEDLNSSQDNIKVVAAFLWQQQSSKLTLQIFISLASACKAPMFIKNF